MLSLERIAMRLLLIEDYQPLQKSLGKGLREEGFAVDVTGDGEEGLWFAQDNDYDLIILDLMIPTIDGLTLLRKLRSMGRKNHVLILTAKDSVADRVRGLNYGADDYVVKPFEFKELLARIRALLRRGYRQKDPKITISDITINTASQRVWRGDEEIELTPKEYALLEYLAMRRGEMVSRTDIWEHVYDFNSTATSNVVDVYIGYLRKKIDKRRTTSLIRTIRGRGYTLGEQHDEVP